MDKPAANFPPRLLLVDDDLPLREILQSRLESQGFEVRGVGNGAQMRHALDHAHYDLIVLDLMLPDESGLAVCRRLRDEGDETPVIMLTAKGDEIDPIVGLETGADDYLPKPVNSHELLSRVRKVLRRMPPPAAGAPQAEGDIFEFGSYRLDLGRRELRCEKEVLRLTSRELAVLAALVRHPHQPVSRDRLMSLVHGRDYEIFERSIDVTIARLRKLLKDDPQQPCILQTVWGIGYAFVPPEPSR